MLELIKAGDLAGLRRQSVEYVALLRSHIHKEDNVLFPMGRDVLSKVELEQLRVKFDEVEDGGKCHHYYNERAEGLLSQVGLPA